jgi:hypothetical protein
MSANAITAIAAGAIHDLIFRPTGLKPMNAKSKNRRENQARPEAGPADRGKYQSAVMQRNAISASGRRR